MTDDSSAPQDDLAPRILAGDRRALARAVTLVESTRPDHRTIATHLIETLRGHERQALRIGLSGTPGVGKSTFIEAFGMALVEAGLRVAVLAVDPSSSRSGGSILGDKTRMERLSRERAAFIRPSPSSSHLGGVARRTREAVALCEAAGFDVVLIETVGVGQSETMVAEMCDLFVLLLGALQGWRYELHVVVQHGALHGRLADETIIPTSTRPDGEVEDRPGHPGRSRITRRAALLAQASRQDPRAFPKAACRSRRLTGDGSVAGRVGRRCRRWRAGARSTAGGTVAAQATGGAIGSRKEVARGARAGPAAVTRPGDSVAHGADGRRLAETSPGGHMTRPNAAAGRNNDSGAD